MSAPVQIPLKEVEAVTNNFDDESFIGEGFLGKIYKGQLSLSGELIDVAVRRLDNSFRLQEMAFDKEISILSRLKHENMVSIVGFCYENDEMLIINKRVARGSLRRHLRDPRLTWTRRLQISVGVVRALSYLHNFGIIHHNINSNSILLDEKWEAKISGFEYSMTIPSGNLDLAYEKLGMGTYKSDVFSMGIVLFELMCGKETFLSKEDNSFQASSAIFHYENRELHKFIDPNLFSQMEQLSFNVFTRTAYNCLIKQSAPPTMDEILKRLERALQVQLMYENNDHSSVVASHRTMPDHLKLKLVALTAKRQGYMHQSAEVTKVDCYVPYVQDLIQNHYRAGGLTFYSYGIELESLQHMRIQLKDILTATRNFSKDNILTSGGFGSVYISELEHVDKEYCLAIETESKRQVPKKRSTVAIKNIEDAEDEIAEQGFYAEIEMLTSCKHSNIITLLGFCDERGTMILIYEYASNGSLSYYLQNMKHNHNDRWAQLLKICIDAAKGLSFLHTIDGDRQEVVHRDIKSANILLDGNLEAKIGDFGLSIFPFSREKHYNTQYSRNVVGTHVYMDPQYRKDATLKKESDVYSFGVVLFEILCGTVAYHKKYNNKGLALIGREHFVNGTIMEILDPKIKEEITKTMFTSVKGPVQESLDTFAKIAYECLAKAQDDRPIMTNVVKELQKALLFQETRDDILRFAPKDIMLALDDGKDHQFGKKYIEKVSRAYGNTVEVKDEHRSYAFSYEVKLKVGRKYRHENIIRLLGYCEQEENMLIVYEHALSGSLDMHLNNPQLTWGKRLKICIGIATGLDFLHEGRSVIGEAVILNNIRSSTILLDADMNAKISLWDSHTHLVDEKECQSHSVDGCYVPHSPYNEYTITKQDIEATQRKEWVIYLFGIVLFEVMLQGVASSLEPESKGYAFGTLVNDLYKKGKLDELMFESKNEEIIVPQSLQIYRRIAIQCLNDEIEERPTAREVAIQLKQALEIQEKGMDILRISLGDIKRATNNFSDERCLGRGAHGNVYMGQLLHANEQKIIVAKCWGGAARKFYQELEILFKFMHKNIIGLEGYCNEMGEKITVYEYARGGSLDRLLDKSSLNWRKRLEICVDVANGLGFLHGDVLRREGVLHRNIKSSNILLSWDSTAKITSFGLSLIRPNNKKFYDIVIGEPIGNIDPRCMETGKKCTISKADDIYSFGVVLFEILCGRLAHPSSANNHQYLIPLAKNYYEKNKLDELVFESIKEQHIMAESLSTFANIAYKCLHDDPHMRPTASDVQEQLRKALELQVDRENWEAKLPSDYKEIFQESRTPEICDTEKKERLYNMLSEGIFIQKGKVWLWLDSNNNKNKMISSTLFTYHNQSSQRWRRVRRSRFERVSVLADISNLKIQIQIDAQFLTPDIDYGIFLVFKFGEPNKTSSKPKYVNLKYKKENETLHAYFASWRDDNWMMIELYRFFNNEDDHDFEVLLEGFSRYYCRNGDVYFEGIEFRALDNVRSNSNMGQMQQFPPHDAKLIKMNRKKTRMFSAEEVLHYSMKPFKVNLSEQSRFGEVIEVLSRQVLCFQTLISRDRLSPNTDYSCYLIFKLSEKCRGLHCPIKLRDIQENRRNKGTKALYFRSPNAWNKLDINHVPKESEDGWMEVYLGMYKAQDAYNYGLIDVYWKLISYEGTMSGLLVGGLEFRPV